MASCPSQRKRFQAPAQLVEVLGRREMTLETAILGVGGLNRCKQGGRPIHPTRLQ